MLDVAERNRSAGGFVAAPCGEFYAGREAVQSHGLPPRAVAFGGPHFATVKFRGELGRDEVGRGGNAWTRKPRANPCGNFATGEIFSCLRAASAA